MDRNKNISAYLQMDEEVWITREFLADLFAYHGWPTDVFPREHACAVPECRRVASAYGGPGGGFAEFCVEHNRCRFCARPTQFDKNLCGFCHNDEQHGVKREQCTLPECPHRVVRLAHPSGSISRFCYQHNMCQGCKRECDFSATFCCNCTIDANMNGQTENPQVGPW